MAKKKYFGTGAISATDYKNIRWVGKTKGGQAVQIKIDNGINLGNTEWTFADKNDTVSEIVFTACYDQEDLDAGKTTEPWEVEYDDGTTAGEEVIILGAGKLYIGETPIALTRGGGKFTRTPEYRRIEADGDRGPVKGRIVIESVEVTLSMTTLEILTKLTDIYTGIEIVTPPQEETPET